MTPAAVRASIAALLADDLNLHHDAAAATAQNLVDRLTADGWEIKSTSPARPVAPRARESSRALVAPVLGDEDTPTRRLVPRRTRTDGATP
ncbi:hypothetical protein ACFYVL_27735 [Streptomyces sp. NPDC004111]|uniref:hypothetical protein n=1 Tax=Streptomyces sp. NPDC004111 TaxID=3364690 RepID=UPI0036B5D1BC